MSINLNFDILKLVNLEMTMTKNVYVRNKTVTCEFDLSGITKYEDLLVLHFMAFKVF